MASKGRDLGNIVSPKTGIAVTMSGDPIVLGVGNTENLRITGSGDVTISDGDLVIGTAGHGIDFSAQTGVSTTGASTSAELLDHYEEGSWTPVYYGADTAGTYTISNTSNSGYYTRIGNIVWIKCSMVDISTSSAGSGQLRIGGIPFVNDSNNSSHGTVNLDKFNIDDATMSLVARIPAGANYIQIYQIRDNTTDSAMDVTDKTSDTSDIFITLIYST